VLIAPCAPLPQVLEDVTEYDTSGGERKTTKLDHILLNGTNVALLVPGSSPEDAAAMYVGPKPASGGAR